MDGILTRLATGDVTWFANALVRVVGLCLLLTSWLSTRFCWRLEHVPPPHQPTLLEFSVAGLAVVALSLGITSSIEGADLFRLQPLPPRPWVPMKRNNDERPDVAGGFQRALSADVRLRAPV